MRIGTSVLLLLAAACFALAGEEASEPVRSVAPNDFVQLSEVGHSGAICLVSAEPERFELALHLCRDGVNVEVVDRKRPEKEGFRWYEAGGSFPDGPGVVFDGRFDDLSIVVRDTAGTGDFAAAKLQVVVLLGEESLALPVTPKEKVSECVVGHIISEGGGDYSVFNLSMGSIPAVAEEEEEEVPEIPELDTGSSVEWSDGRTVSPLRFELIVSDGSTAELAVLLAGEGGLKTFVPGSPASAGLSFGDAGAVHPRAVTVNADGDFEALYFCAAMPEGGEFAAGDELVLRASPLDPALRCDVPVVVEAGSSMTVVAVLDRPRAGRLRLTAVNRPVK